MVYSGGGAPCLLWRHSLSGDAQTDRVVYLPVAIIPDKVSKRKHRRMGLYDMIRLLRRHVESADSCPLSPYEEDSTLPKHLIILISNGQSHHAMDLLTSC